MIEKIIAVLATITTLGYLLPTGVALARGHRNVAAIFVLNSVTGWTFIGWVAALVWSFTTQKNATT